MKRSMGLMLALALVCGGAVAGEKHAPAGQAATKQVSHLNNVVVMTAEGERTALCACGREFTVTDAEFAVQHGEATVYCCSPECHAKLDALTEAEIDAALAGYWQKFPVERTLNTAAARDGQTTARCFCGKQVDVTAASPMVLENGVRVYPCSEACETALHQMGPAKRLKIERQFVLNASGSGKGY